MSRRVLKIVTILNVAVLCALFVLHVVWLRQRSELERRERGVFEVFQSEAVREEAEGTAGYTMAMDMIGMRSVAKRFERRAVLLFYGAACPFLLNVTLALYYLVCTAEP